MIGESSRAPNYCILCVSVGCVGCVGFFEICFFKNNFFIFLIFFSQTLLKPYTSYTPYTK